MNRRAVGQGAVTVAAQHAHHATHQIRRRPSAGRRTLTMGATRVPDITFGLPSQYALFPFCASRDQAAALTQSATAFTNN